ncbi:DUF1330 domain-containing protein [Pelagibius sp. Alg239-R121]|uniref:DUF1330 domain-containing protein n=1 Tax=Pelagibius sp. Alg239-R121 TaxID=2993448 RepID=UPI0024A68C55|nr:DUF1330 domain-containing protein [Pelagibius sp. Alg239-R121]
MSAIMISQIKVTDPEAFQAYLSKTQEIARPYGAELLFRGRMGDVLNGQPEGHHLVVIARFPDAATIQRWHASPEYQALIPLRDQGSSQIMVTYDEIM